MSTKEKDILDELEESGISEGQANQAIVELEKDGHLKITGVDDAGDLEWAITPKGADYLGKVLAQLANLGKEEDTDGSC